MATLYNQNGTNAAEILDFTVDGIYHAKGGNDTINIKGGSVIVYTDSGNNTINVTGGRGHTIKVAADDKESDKGYGVERLTIDGADAVEAYLGAGNDEIVLVNTNGRKTSGASSAIHGGAWSDTFTVKAGARNYQLYGDAGNDTFNISGGSNMNFWGGAANDTFNVTGGTNNKLYGGDSADTFNISAGSQNLILGYGKDVVNITSGDKQQIKANLGINTINLKAGSGHVITADVDRAASKKKGYTDEQIDAGQGIGYGQDKVYISSTASEVTVHLGDGRDYVSVSSGSGHEIYTEGWNDTIDISGTTSDSLFDAGAGNDIINIKGGNNNEVIGGTGSDTYNVTWTLGNQLYIDTDDYIVGDKETININLDKSAFDFAFGNGSLFLTDKKGGSIEIGLMEGITTSANFDGISFNGQFMSAEQIQAIAKNNIEMHNPSLYSGSDGKDVFLMTVDNKNNKGFIYNIDNFGDEDAILATKLMTNAWGSVTYGGHTQSGNDLLVYINGVDKGETTKIGTVCLKDYFLNSNERKLNVCGETVNVTSVISQLDVIQKLMSSLDNTTLNGYDAMDEAVNACSFGKYSSLNSLVNSFINDCTGHSGTKYSAAQTEFLKKYCGIDLDNEDTGAITGADAGGVTVKTKESIVEEKNFNPNAYIYNTNDYFTLTSNQVEAYFSIDANAAIYGKTVDGVTFYWSDDNINKLVASGYSEDNLKQIISGVVNVWADPAMKLVKESYNLSMDSEGSTWKRLSDGTVGIQLYLEDKPNNNTLASVNSHYWWYNSEPNITTKTNGALVINASYFNNGFSDENGDSGNSSSGYLDRVLAHEMVHGVMDANINMTSKLPTFIKEGLAELVHGVDDNRKNEILDLSNINYSSTWTSSVSGSTTYNQREFLNALFDMNNANAKFSRYTYGGGYMLLRYLAKQTADYCASAGINSYGTDSLLSDYTSRYGAAANAMLGFSESSLTGGAGANSFGAQLNDGSDRKMFVTGNK